MDYMTFVLITVPLAVLAAYIVKTLSIRKVPSPDSVLHRAVKSEAFSGGADNFHELVLTLASKPGYKLRMRTDKSAYITEPYIKWKRGVMCYYIALDEPHQCIEVYYKNLVYSDAYVAEAMNAIMAHFQEKDA